MFIQQVKSLLVTSPHASNVSQVREAETIMYQPIPIRAIAGILLAGSSLGINNVAQNARLEPDAELVITQAEKPDGDGAFFLPNPESRSVVAAARAVALNEVGTAAYARQSFEEAIVAFRRSIDENPTVSAVHLNLSIALAAAGRTKEAVAPALEAVRLGPQNPRARAGLCGLYLELKNAKSAIDCFDELIRSSPADPAYMAERNTALFVLGKKAEAIESMREFVRRFPSHAGGFNYLGVMLYETKDISKAIDAFRTAISVDPDSDIYRYNFGLALLAKHDKAGALAQYDLLKERSPEFAGKLYRQIYADKLLVLEK